MALVKSIKSPAFIILAFALIPFAGCGAGASRASLEKALASNDNQAQGEQKTGDREVGLNEQFKLEPKEKVSIKDTKLTVGLQGVRRSWRADGKGEYVDAEVVTTLGGTEQRQWMKIGDETLAGDYLVRLTAAYPFGKTNAELIVKHR